VLHGLIPANLSGAPIFDCIWSILVHKISLLDEFWNFDWTTFSYFCPLSCSTVGYQNFSAFMWIYLIWGQIWYHFFLIQQLTHHSLASCKHSTSLFDIWSDQTKFYYDQKALDWNLHIPSEDLITISMIHLEFIILEMYAITTDLIWIAYLM